MPYRGLITAFEFAAFWTVFILTSVGGVEAEEPLTRVLLIGKQPDHPPGTHRYLPTCRLLAHCLEQTPGVAATVSDGWPQDEGAVDGIDSIVLYRAPFAQQMLEGPDSTSILRALDRGAGLVTIHWSTGVDSADWDRIAPRMAAYQGGVWRSRSQQVRIGQSPFTNLLPEHPLSRGWRIKTLRDEWYLSPEISPEAKHLWRIEHEGDPLTVAWTYERPDGGRTFATTLGHFWDNFTREPFRRAIVNGVLWTAKAEIPEEGAPVEVTGDQLVQPDSRQP